MAEKATTKQMAQNLGVGILGAAGLLATGAFTAWALNYSSTYMVAGFAGLIEKTHYSNLFVKKAVAK